MDGRTFTFRSRTRSAPFIPHLRIGYRSKAPHGGPVATAPRGNYPAHDGARLMVALSLFLWLGKLDPCRLTEHGDVFPQRLGLGRPGDLRRVLLEISLNLLALGGIHLT